MRIEKLPTEWNVFSEEADNKMSLVNTVRFLERVSEQVAEASIEGLILHLDLSALDKANSELIAQFVMLQSNLVRTNGRLRIINANAELKSSFDVVMLDKIISITYIGIDPDDESDSDYGDEE